MAEAQESRLSIVIDTKNAEKRIKELRKQLRELGQQSDETGDNTDDLGRRQRRASDDAGNLGSANDKAKKSLDSMAKAAAIAGAALAGAVGLSINKAIDFESTIASVSKVVDATLATSIDDIANGLKELSTQIPLSVNELGEIAAAGGQLGVTADDLLGYVETVSKMAVAFDMTAASAGESMAVLSNVLQKPIDQMAAIGDMINEVSNSTPAAASDIISALKDVGGAFTAFGIADDFAVALTGTMIAVGEESGRASNALTSMLTTFGTLDMATKRQLGGFEQLGINVDNFSQLMKVDAQQAIMDFSESLRQIPAAERLGVATKIFGRDYALAITKTINANELFGETLKSIELDANGVSAALGSMEKEYQAISATTANKMKLFKSNIDQAAISLGEVFIPALNELLLNMTPMIAVIGAWVAANPELVKQIVVISGALLGSIVSLKLAVDGFTAAKETIDGLKVAFEIIGPAVKSAFAFLTGGIGLPLIAIAALIAAGVLLYQNWDLVKEKASELNEWIKSKFGSLPEPLQQAGRDIAEVFIFIWNTGKEYLTLMSELYSGTFESFKTIATGAFQVVWSVIKVSFSGIVNTISTALQLAATLFSGGFALIKNTVTTVLDVIKAVITGDFKAIPGIIGSGLKSAASIVDSMMTNILNIIKNAGKQLYSIGRDFIQGFYNGIKSMASGVASAASTMVGNAIAAVKKRQDSASPSKVTTKLGQDFSKGMANGIKKGAKAVKSEAQKMAEQAIKAVEDGIAGFQKRIALFGDNSELSSLLYDIDVGKFKGASQARIDEWVKQATALQNLESQLKATNSVQARFDKWQDERDAMRKKATGLITDRFAQFNSDKASSSDNLQGMLGGIEQESPLGKIQADYEARLELIEQYENTHTDMLETAKEARLAVEQSYMDAKQQLMLSQSEAIFSGLAGMAKGFLGEQSGIYRALYTMQKMYTLSSAVLSSKKAIMDAWANTPGTYFTKALAAGKVVLSTSAITNAISDLAPQGFKAGGYTGNVGASQVAGVVHGQEYVFDAQSTKRIGVDNLNAMRSGKSVGETKVIVNNYSNEKANVQTTPDGDTIVTIGKIVSQMVDGKLSTWERNSKRQGHALHGMR